MADNLPQFLDNLRGSIAEDNTTTDLRMSIEDFTRKLIELPDGKELAKLLMEGELKIAVRMGLINVEPDGYHIPRWNNLIEHLRILQSVFSTPEE